MVIYDISEDFWKIFKIYGYFGNFEKNGNFGKILNFFENFGKKIDNFGKKLKLWKKIENFEKKFQSRRQILTARGGYGLKIA